jgi:hypothetical protein
MRKGILGQVEERVYVGVEGVYPLLSEELSASNLNLSRETCQAEDRTYSERSLMSSTIIW